MWRLHKGKEAYATRTHTRARDNSAAYTLPGPMQPSGQPRRIPRHHGTISAGEGDSSRGSPTGWPTGASNQIRREEKRCPSARSLWHQRETQHLPRLIREAIYKHAPIPKIRAELDLDILSRKGSRIRCWSSSARIHSLCPALRSVRLRQGRVQ